MTTQDVLDRAKSAIGMKCKYVLGKGGRRPGAPFPWGDSSAPRECDCSGFAAWCIGEDRYTDNPWYRSLNGGWIETTAIVRDSRTPFGLFDEVAWAEAQPGMLIVYGDVKVAGVRKQGHVGIISGITVGGPSRVIHCSSGNFKRTKDAIQETGPEPWVKRKDSIVARCALVEDVA